LGEYSITFSIRGYIKLRDYWDVYFAIREQILLAFRERGIRIPFKRVVVEDYQMSRERINASISTIEK
ncbi:MAG: mechanosensitive ion channel family protein, partial [Bacilli bacterium]|nr:mechanosensitive ion channel family protein [Bacilli bacterium]